jgi:hypothetical protein
VEWCCEGEEGAGWGLYRRGRAEGGRRAVPVANQKTRAASLLTKGERRHSGGSRGGEGGSRRQGRDRGVGSRSRRACVAPRGRGASCAGGLLSVLSPWARVTVGWASQYRAGLERGRGSRVAQERRERRPDSCKERGGAWHLWPGHAKREEKEKGCMRPPTWKEG